MNIKYFDAKERSLRNVKSEWNPVLRSYHKWGQLSLTATLCLLEQMHSHFLVCFPRWYSQWPHMVSAEQAFPLSQGGHSKWTPQTNPVVRLYFMFMHFAQQKVLWFARSPFCFIIYKTWALAGDNIENWRWKPASTAGNSVRLHQTGVQIAWLRDASRSLAITRLSLHTIWESASTG